MQPAARNHGAGVVAAVFLHLFHSVVCLSGDLRHPRFPPVIWFAQSPMFNNRTNPARIVVQMHDSLDFFCPDYINSQYQSFTGAKKLPSEYGAEEIYMVDGQDYQSCFAGLSRGRLAKNYARLLLRCPGKTHSPDTKAKAKFQYTVSFRMFSPVPKGPEFSCNQEYYFLGIFPGHNHDEEAIEKALCSVTALRLQIFVSCSDSVHQQTLFPYSSPNVVQLDRPAQSSELTMTTLPTGIPSPDDESTSSSVSSGNERGSVGRESSRAPNGKIRASRPPVLPANGMHVARSDRKIMRNNDGLTRQPSSRRMQASTVASITTAVSPDGYDGSEDTVRLVVDFDGEPDAVLTRSPSTPRKSTSKPSVKQLPQESAATSVRSQHDTRFNICLAFFLFIFVRLIARYR